MVTAAVASLSVVAWMYLLAARGGFWRADIRDDADTLPLPSRWPSVAAVIPARNEADVICVTLQSLFRQSYPSAFPIFVVDDNSGDGTAVAARSAAEADGHADRLHVIDGAPLPPGWTGKLWAVSQGIAAAETLSESPDYLLLTDADIAYDDGVLKRLVARACAGDLVLTSLMVKLRCESLAERMLIPAFVFFFQMLYPFAQVNLRNGPVAAAAGGCMLVRRETLKTAGGIGAIRTALIDDCALGRVMKRWGPIWLGLTGSAHSLRPYPSFGDIRRMVARSAFDQLGYSTLKLAVTVLGMALIYAAPPLLAVFTEGPAQVLGAIAWGLMTLAYFPIVRFYKLSLFWSLALPGIAAFYMAFTLESAYRHWRGQGGMWKGRAQAPGLKTQ